MTTHSKGSYVAFRSGRNAPSKRELVARQRVAEACREYCNEPFPEKGELLRYTLDDYNRETLEVKASV